MPGRLLLQLAALLPLAVVAAANGQSRQLGGHRKRQPGAEEVVFDKTSIPYCNYPNNVAIPPLSEGLVERTPGLRLLQVQVVARHGSRTPYKVYDPTCWAGYVWYPTINFQVRGEYIYRHTHIERGRQKERRTEAV